jgi:hypothetical protein
MSSCSLLLMLARLAEVVAPVMKQFFGLVARGAQVATIFLGRVPYPFSVGTGVYQSVVLE